MTQQIPTPGMALRSLREMSGMTLEQVAEGAETHLSYLSKVERGRLHPSQDYVARVAAFISSAILSNGTKTKKPAALSA